MKRLLLSIILSASATFAFAQAVPDASFTDCNGTTRSVYQALAAGKVLVVANAGTNCSICQGHAPSVANLANNNPNSIEVWGSITTKTGGNPGCTALNSWVSTYSWTNVFSFLDSNKYWFVTATPRYTVINPADSSIAYAGGNWTTAQNTATQLASAFSVEESKLVSKMAVLPMAIRVSFSAPSKSGEAILYNITGAQLQHWVVPSGATTIELPLLRSPNRGLYLLRFSVGGKEAIEKIMF